MGYDICMMITNTYTSPMPDYDFSVQMITDDTCQFAPLTYRARNFVSDGAMGVWIDDTMVVFVESWEADGLMDTLANMGYHIVVERGMDV
jgi:hypothetical protein